jgi:hypothetical protein
VTAATIGIDVGTSGVRVALMDACGALLGIRSSRLEPSDRRNPACWWHAVESALAALKASADFSGVCCIAVDGRASGSTAGIRRARRFMVWRPIREHRRELSTAISCCVCHGSITADHYTRSRACWDCELVHLST